MNNNTVKPMIEAGMLTSIFVVLTLVSNMIGLGLIGYYDFLVPVFYAILFVRSGWKYGLLSVISSTVIIFFILGNPITPLMVLQGATLGLLNGFLIRRLKSIGDEIVFISIGSLAVIFIFDIILRVFTNLSIISNFSEFSKDMTQVIDSAIKMVVDKGNSDSAMVVLMNYKSLIGSNYMKQAFYFSFALMSLGTGFIVYFLSLISLKKLNINITSNQEKLNLIGNLKKNIRFIFTSRKLFSFMIIYVLLVEILKLFDMKSGIEYIDGIIFSIEYLFTLFTFKDAMVITENKMIAESGSVKSVRWYRILVIFMLLFNIKLMYIAVIVNYIINDRDGKYRELFMSALRKSLKS